jgi:hypothetical protein
MTQTAAETYTNDTGSWGWTTGGRLFCSTCKGRTEIRCTRNWELEGPFDDGDGEYWMCEGCCEPIDRAGRGHRRHSCPTCER